MSIIVSIALATICFTYQGVEECHPVLLGKKIPTPVGEFTVHKRITRDPGYGGDVLQFHETKDLVYAIHRVWLLNPEQKRMERIRSNNIKDRFISSGCINVEPAVYDKLMDCCSNSTLTIK
jgi:signal peptidase I